MRPHTNVMMCHRPSRITSLIRTNPPSSDKMGKLEIFTFSRFLHFYIIIIIMKYNDLKNQNNIDLHILQAPIAANRNACGAACW